jgi:hypothetical protein
MDKRSCNIAFIIVAVFTLGLVGVRYDDPIEQAGILALLGSGIGTIFLITKLTQGVKSIERVFTIMASFICLLVVCSIVSWPFLWYILLSYIVTAGLLGLIVMRLNNIKKTSQTTSGNLYVIFSSIILVIILVDYLFRLGITSNIAVRILIPVLLFFIGGYILKNKRDRPMQNYPAILLIVMYAAMDVVLFVTSIG